MPFFKKGEDPPQETPGARIEAPSTEVHADLATNETPARTNPAGEEFVSDAALAAARPEETPEAPVKAPQGDPKCVECGSGQIAVYRDAGPYCRECA